MVIFSSLQYVLPMDKSKGMQKIECDSTKEVISKGGSSMLAEDNKATNRRFYEEVINQKHLAVVDEVAGATYVNHSFPPGLPPGREGLKAFVGAFHAAFPDGQLSIDQ